MGSRKKKQAKSQSRVFIEAYKALPLNERIAFKAWAYWYGRQRYSLYEMIKSNYRVANIQWRNY